MLNNMSEKFPDTNEVQKSPAQILRETAKTLRRISEEASEKEE